jgi:hypothetical protein
MKYALDAARDTLAIARGQLASARINVTTEIGQWERSVSYWESEVERLTDLVEQGRQP